MILSDFILVKKFYTEKPDMIGDVDRSDEEYGTLARKYTSIRYRGLTSSLRRSDGSKVSDSILPKRIILDILEDDKSISYVNKITLLSGIILYFHNGKLIPEPLTEDIDSIEDIEELDSSVCNVINNNPFKDIPF